MKNSLIIILLTALVLTLALPLAQDRLESEKAFTSDNLIMIENSAAR